MKKNIIILMIFISTFLQAQTVDIKSSNHPADMPQGSYIKDIDGDFDKFNGTWKWIEQGKTLTFKLQKVVRYLDPEYNIYIDFMIGDYEYIVDNATIINTINQTNNMNPDLHPLYTGCPRSNTKIDFIFEDVIIGKTGCRAIFEFLPGSTTQMKLTLKNPEGPIGFLVPEGQASVPILYNHDFTIPNEIILTRQP